MERGASSPARSDPVKRLRMLACLYLAGATIGLVALAFFPMPAGTDLHGTLITACIALGLGFALLVGARWLPAGAMPVALALGTVVVTLNLYFAGDIRTNDEMFYLWVAFFAFYFLAWRVAVLELLGVAVAYGTVLTLRHEPDGSTRWLITMGTLAMAGALTRRLLVQLERWSERSTEREQQLRLAEARFRSAFDDASVGMALTDLDGRWLRINRALADLVGYPREQLIGRSFRDLTPPDEIPRDRQALSDLVSGRIDVYQAEKRYRRADGTHVWIALSVSRVRDDLGHTVRLIAQMQDISDRKAAERELAEQALRDPLTGLPNRRLFLDRTGQALRRLEREPGSVAVLFIDLDRFKLVNDSLGHSAGDRMLVEVGERLRHVLRPADTISRFGGDEFTVLCENTDEAGGEAIAERIHSALAAPLSVDGQELFVTAAIGVSVSRNASAAAEGMLRDADAAMYRAKAEGRGSSVLFTSAMHDDATERLTLENDLRRALERDELRLAYQPLVDLRSGRVYGVEALVRWEHPTRGRLAPGQFIDLAEESGLIVPLGRWVLQEACRQSRAWNETGLDLLVSLNLSPRQLLDPALIDDVRDALHSTQITPSRVCLELTESAAVGPGAGRLRELKALGVHLALDDFGVGFSSLDQIRRLPPVDTLKIDRSFISEINASGAGAAIAAAIIGISNALGLETVAEGIEQQSQVDALRAVGCERGQGFFYARPVDPAEIEGLVLASRVRRLHVSAA